MGRTRRCGSADLARAAALGLLLSAYNNLLAHRPWHRHWYLPVNAAATAVLLAVARGSGLSSEELGLARGRAAAGVKVGALLGTGIGVGLAAATVVPRLRPVLRDARIESLSWPAVAHHATLRIPVGTALWEEAAFRGALLAAFARLMPVPAAVFWSSVLFGVWHVRPALDMVRINRPGASRRALGVAVGGTVVVTAAAGAFLCVLRLRSGSLAAPILVHAASNSFGTVSAAVSGRMP